MAERLTLTDLEALPSKGRRLSLGDLEKMPSPPSDFLGVAEDVAKSAGIGLAQGALGLATLPGNIEQLGRYGVDAAARASGMGDPQLSQGQFLPTYGDAKSAVEQVTGEFYRPKTVVGEYARTLGEFAPNAGFPAASGLARVVNVAAPAVVSETAGQIARGVGSGEHEAAARIAGALAGGVVPKDIMRAATPITNAPARQAAVNLLESEGVTSLTAGQRTGNKGLRWAEAASADVPGGGRRAGQIMDAQAEEFTRAALRSAGVNETRATLPVLDDAFDALGNQFDNLARNNAIRADRQLFDDFGTAWREYSRVKGQSARAPVVEDTIRDVTNAVQNPRNQGLFSGEAYQTLRHDLGRIQRSQAQTDPALSQAVGAIRDALDNAMERSIAPDLAQQWRTIREQYQNLLAIEKARLGAGENTALGLISPSQLRNAVKNQNSRAFSRGQRPLARLADAGEAVLKPLPSSGTAQRLAAQDLFNPMALARALSARTVMSRPVQNWLANQRFANAISAYESIQPSAAMGVPNALMQFQPLRGSQEGLMLDENGNPIR